MEKRRDQRRRGGHHQKRGNDASKKTSWTKSPYQSTNQSKPFRGPSKSTVAKKKVHLSFDEDDRQTFLTGFQKRKAERKQRAKAELEERAKEEVKRIKERREEKLRKLVTDNSLAKELDQHAEYSLDYELPEQTVSIKGLDIVNISSSLGLTMGANKPKAELEPEPPKKADDSESEHGDDDQTAEPQTSESIRANLKQIKKSHSRALQKSKVMKAKQRLKTKKAAQIKRFGTKASRKAKARDAGH